MTKFSTDFSLPAGKTRLSDSRHRQRGCASVYTSTSSTSSSACILGAL